MNASASSTLFARSADGTRIAYDVTGRGPALLLLHGGNLDRLTWHDMGYVRRLRSDFTIITMDARGHGASDRPTEPSAYTADKICQDQLAVVDAAGVDRFAVWGFSYGANMGRYLAACSDRPVKIVLMGEPFGPGASGGFRDTILRRCAHWGPILAAHAQGALDPAALSAEDYRELETGSAAVVHAFLSALLDWPPIVPADLRCPALCLVGSRNTEAIANLKEYGQAIHRAGVRVCVLDGFDHWQEFAEIETVLPIMLAFTCE